jgi:predicted RNA-binding Zn-ribbon protein involved in translation (DUF1610 family)
LILAEWLQYPVKRKALPEFQQLFPDDAACAAYLEKARWDAGFICPHCGEVGACGCTMTG